MRTCRARWLHYFAMRAMTLSPCWIRASVVMPIRTWPRCAWRKRALVTLDVDFANVRRYPPSDHHGLIVLRLGRQDKLHVLAILRRLIPLLEREPIEKRLWIVEEERIRIRE